MNTMLNRAVVDFEDYYAWPWLRKQISGPAPLTISDLKYVRSVFDSTGTEYFGLGDSDDVYRSDTGTPTAWWIDDTSGSPVLTAYPVGSVSFIVNYVATSSPLTSDSDTPKIPAAYHTTWVDLAVVQAYKDSDNFAAAGALRQAVEGDLQRMVEVYETRNRMNSRQRLVRAGSEDE
jgi:hypothetical protein